MRVLFVEDSRHLQTPVVKALKASGYAVDSAMEGTEGHWFARTHDYDVMVLDIMLPGMSGLEILQKIRKEGNETPVLFLTAKDSIEDRVTGLKQGADDYLVKPFALDELLARVEALSRRRYETRSVELQVDDLVVDTARKTVTRAGKPLALAAREYALLEYLMHRAGRVVSRTEIEEHIYDDLDSPMSNVIDSAICSLRKSIDVSGKSRPLIHTRRGHGYILERRSP